MLSKKTVIVSILEILKKYSDENHRLSQKDILDYLKSDHNTEIDRKAVKRNLSFLIECGVPLEYSVTARTDKNGNTHEMLTDFYFVREFTDAELRLLIDSVLFSKHIPTKQCKRLVDKIAGLSSVYFSQKVKHMSNLPEGKPTGPELFYSIEIIDEAIGKNRQIAFEYCDFHTDKKLYPRLRDDGTVRIYEVSPYQMVATNGRYYLITCLDKYDTVTHFRMDRIRNVRILHHKAAKPVRSVKEFQNGLSLPKHMAEHIYMFSGENQRVVFEADKYIVTDIIDWFGNGVRFFEETEDNVKATVSVNLRAMKYWCMQYGKKVRVISPAILAEQIKKELTEALSAYEEN